MSDLDPKPTPEVAEALNRVAGTLGDGTGAPAAVLEEMFARLQQQVTREQQRPLRRWSAAATRWRGGAMLGAGLVATVVGLIKLRPDLDSYPWYRLLLELLVFTGAGSVWVAIWLRPLYRPALPIWLQRVAFASALLLPFITLPVLIWLQGGHAGSLTGHTLALAVPCFTFAAALSIPMVLMGLLLDRGGLRSSLSTAGPALAGALFGLAGLHLHCPGRDPWHLLLGHALVVPLLALATLAGVSLYQRLRRRRRRPLYRGGMQ